ncbi:dynein axonemal heavy chain 2-like isoform X4 [Symsagittifera roscoffensis]|uniref:dynein axonemal heavy chain 2-like isoform X4 n=1 Tax=Symsagittifera roscoffensis TaxID=84072 RepID=UPI00307B1D8D
MADPDEIQVDPPIPENDSENKPEEMSSDRPDTKRTGRGSRSSQSGSEVEEPDVKPYLKGMIGLIEYDESSHLFTPEMDDLMDDWIENKIKNRCLFVYVDGDAIKVTTELPHKTVHSIQYFAKKGDVELFMDNVEQFVTHGIIHVPHIESLLKQMNGAFSPMFLSNKTWPDSIRNDFTSHLQRFMAYLTDMRHKTEGHTILYIPKEGAAAAEDVAAACADKDLVQRLETVMIHWTMQLKEVVYAQDSQEITENSGPLEEIEFWRNRCVDLSSISTQLDKPEVKKIESILDAVKSSYVGQFRKYAQQIQDGSKQSENNLKFLNILKEPCDQLSKASAKEIPPMLPNLLNLIRFVWTNSDFYNTKERITGLLRKLSNEIILRCSKEIHLDKIFEGYCITCVNTLNQAINCCSQWKQTYERVSKAHQTVTGQEWVLDKTSVFAQIEAFIQRCRDLIEVCECQMHFARYEDGQQTKMPIFPGQRGPDVVRSLQEIEHTFRRNLVILKDIKHTILDVKATSWHDDYNKFRNGVKDLEVMMQNTISSAFEAVRTVEQGVDLLDIFRHLSTRETIKRTLDKKVVEVVGMFCEEMNKVKKELNNKRPYLSLQYPKYSGQAHWIKALKRRLDYNFKVIEAAFFVNETPVFEEAKQTYLQLTSNLDDTVRKHFTEWQMLAEKEIGKGSKNDAHKRLEQPLMIRSHDRHGMIEVNFDRFLQKLFVEVHYWHRLMFEVPHYAGEVYQKRDELMKLREQVLFVVLDYNRVVSALTAEERSLFKERIRFLDKKLHPGLTKLMWVTKGVSEFFINDCRKNIASIQNVVDEYKFNNMNVSASCKKISEQLMVVIRKDIYSNLEFEEEQAAHQKKVAAILNAERSEVVNFLLKTNEYFRRDGPDVQQGFFNYTDKMDRMVEEAFRLNIKWSLQELSKAINGDGKTPPNPLFKVKLVLEDDQRIEFDPTLKKLHSIVNSIGPQLISKLHSTPRLPDVLSKFKSSKPPLTEVFENDNEIKKLQKTIADGMNKNSVDIHEYLVRWDGYREIWEIKKDMFIKRYQRLNPSVASFDGDIARYNEVSHSAQKEDTITNISFIMLDSSQLKRAIQEHCKLWQDKFTTLLKEIASEKLNNLTEFFEQHCEKLRQDPADLEALGDAIKLHEQLQGERDTIEGMISPIQDQFAILEKNEVAIPEETREKLDNLSNHYLLFQQALQEAETIIKKAKDRFKSDLISSAEEYKRKVAQFVADFYSNGPFSEEWTAGNALDKIQSYRDTIASTRVDETRIRKGLAIFKIEQPPSKEIANMENDLKTLDSAWQMTKEWEDSWSGWKVSHFRDINADQMETGAQSLFKKLARLAREIKDRNWPIVETTKKKVEQFRRTMPLITDLKNDALRPRHWTQIQETVGQTFNHEEEKFTLELIIGFGFDSHAEDINTVSGSASKELSIEKAINAIAELWKETKLDLGPYKDKGHFKLKGTDEVFQFLEDNQVQLSTMKASKFVKAFEDQVDYWERTLSKILEVIEITLTVQRQWMYLENIFVGEDIRKQLPKETAEFDMVNSGWKEIMTRMNDNPNAKEATHHPGLFDKLNDMNLKLEDIQKSLDMYLETKRQTFPRFYFLSNDDLLEILGQSRNPEAVQPHLKKCFDNIVKLRMQKAVGLSNKLEGTGMFSADGELVEFTQGQNKTLDGAVENWLCEVEKSMRATLKESLKNTRAALKKSMTKRDKWCKDWPGQMLISASQIQWTQDCTRALTLTKERGNKKALKSLKRKQTTMLDKFSEAIRTNLPKLMRLKIVALVTVEVHARDVIEKLIKSGCNDVTAFDWLMQLRLYWDKEIDDCVVRQTSTQFQYGYEYLGNSGRLVITPLTDRCYMTLTTALHLHRGGSPKGPAGTGKTETVKDLGKALGDYVIVVNCSEGLDYKSMGRMFSGLAQTGAWGCFDEFNRINIEVLSVVAQQILSILSALSQNLSRFTFEGREINLVWSCGLFITMNPGYAGRTELPDNLKSMFRPISMVVPDSAYIAEIILFGQGFGNTKVLAKKVHTLYTLAIQQLSKQDHYDFGLRGLTSVLRYAGVKKRQKPDTPDEELVLLAMKDMNLAKLTAADLPLFNGITSDLFPGIDVPTVDYSKMKTEIVAELKAQNLQNVIFTETKVIQLYETKNSRHSTMLVGATGSGKSTSWKVLRSVLNRLNDKKEPYLKAKEYPMNPKALNLGELYGEFDLNTNEWTDGVLSSVFRNACADEKEEEKWILFDGPVDAVWIENMNSVMDDNKVLTLTNGDRITMPEQVSLLFEVADLAVASPATVSRCGMVYYDVVDLGFKPFVASWLAGRSDQHSVEHLKRFFDKYIQKIMEFKKINCDEIVKVPEYNIIKSLCYLFDAVATKENGVDHLDETNYPQMLEYWFLFCMIWSVCAAVDEAGRKKIDTYLREMEGTFPNKDSIYEYYVDGKTRTWQHWEEKLKGGWKFDPKLPFYKLIVPTVDTVRYQYLLKMLVKNEKPVLLVGPVGTGKTSVVQQCLAGFDSAKISVLNVNMSAQTSSNNVQDIIETKVEKRTKGVYVPLGGKKLVTFVDDLNMPSKDTYGSQPPLELIRQWMDYEFWYDRQRQTVKYIKGMQVVGAMGPPGGGRTHISERMQSKFNVINMTFPAESQVKRIFGSMITQKLFDFEEELKPLADLMTRATIEMYQQITARYLPTPSRIHYLFNLRDIAKVFQGLLRANKTIIDNKNSMVRLWIHEMFRVFNDRLVDNVDREDFINILDKNLGAMFDQNFHNICPNRVPPLFGDFVNPSQVYEDFEEPKPLKDFMDLQLDEYNTSPGVVAMDLVLFRDAIEHVARIIRVIGQPRGNMMLIGIGGSGRQSMTRLAAYICDFKTFQIEVTRTYRKTEWRDDLKRLYRQAGVDNKPTCFLFVDTQIKEESFLEDINNILSSGEVPNLMKPDEFEEIRTALADIAVKEGVPDTPESIQSYFIERVRANLHVVLAMSPVGEPFRNRIRMYPALVNCTTIDWFSEWPRDALLEVAEKYLEGVDLGEVDERWMSRKENSLNLTKLMESQQMKSNVAQVFTTMHSSVSDMSKKMFEEMKRYNYVTPTNYLELVTGYKQLLAEKRQELGSEISKLRNGLLKIDDTSEKVQVMSQELEVAKAKVAKISKECEEYLVVIVGQKREADEYAKTVSAKREKIEEEKVACKEIADQAEEDLSVAMPALREAETALDSLNKNDITEVKSYAKPPRLVETVMQAVMILKGKEPTWAEGKRDLNDQNFIKSLKDYDKDNMSDRMLKKIGQYVAQPDFLPDTVGKQSSAGKSLCMWVRAMDSYGKVYRVVAPKKARLENAQKVLAAKQAELDEALARLDEVNKKMEELKRQHEEKEAQQKELAEQEANLKIKLDRAEKLVSGLAGEKIRWEEKVSELEENRGFLVGDCLVASAFLSYCGPFLSEYREEMVNNIWLAQIRSLQVPCNPFFSFALFMSRPTTVREWNLQGLPADQFSTENGVVVTRGTRWPLMVDPQGQAIKWIKNMEIKRSLKVIDLQMPDFMRILEGAIQYGTPTLLQNVHEELDPSLEPILKKAVFKQGGRLMIKLGDKELDYHQDFRFYMTTKLANPHYSPEISTKAAIVNFAVKEQGLEAQLLGIVVRKERPELEEQKDTLVLNIAGGKNKLVELENEILRLLNEAQGSLLDDEQLVNTLQQSKITSQEVTESLVISEETEKKIDAARDGYKPCAQRASILFFVLNDMGRIDPMYQFSLDAYIDLFNLSIDRCTKSPRLEERITKLNDFHTYAVYRYTCRGLFERHKLLFSFQMCAKILEAAQKLNLDEYQFFLKGGIVLDREEQMDNPCSQWLTDSNWDNITELDKLANFHGVITSFEQYPRDWSIWYTSAEPEKAVLPGEWEDSCNELQRMIIVRSLRQDRVSFCATTFIQNNLGSRFVEPPVLDMAQVWDDSSTKTPLIFVLSPGVDPTGNLLALASQKNMDARFHALSLGQGQAPIATRMIKEGVKEGNWVFLANCHLSLSWMPQLDKLVEQLQIEETHKDFRLWLSSSPNPDFPIAILQSGLKMTTEPPKGLKANLKRLYGLITDDQFHKCQMQSKYKKLLFSLCFFHSVLIERRKFRQLGWNVFYGFNDSDFEVSENLLCIYLDEYKDDTPWDTLKYLIAGVNYGGHVTDDWDRRLLTTYINDYFTPDAIEVPFFKLSSLPTYIIPRDGTKNWYAEEINRLPTMDHPEAFGQHPNADIASQITETRTLLETLLSLQPQVSAGAGGQTVEDKVLQLAGDVLSKVPDPLDYDGTAKILKDDLSPVNVVLLQEIQRYNSLLKQIKSSLVDLQKGIQGLVVMSSDLEEVFSCINEARVPPQWAKAYPTLKPLGSWTRDLIQRVDFYEKWCSTAKPPSIFWLAAFTFPTGFLTALLQTAARQNNISVDSLSWEFTVLTIDDSNITGPPRDGAYIKGLYLEGAGWDKKNSTLVEAEPMQLVSGMPSIHFKPVENKRKAGKGMYACPCYYFPDRAGAGNRPSFVVAVDLKSGEKSPDHWVKRGTALLMSLAT